MSHIEQNPHSRKQIDYKRKTRPDLKNPHPHSKTVQNAKQIEHKAERHAIAQALHIPMGPPLTEEEGWMVESKARVIKEVHESTPPPVRAAQESLKDSLIKKNL